jgi:hypothetical protein
LIWFGDASITGAATSPNHTRVSDPGNCVGTATSIGVDAIVVERFEPRIVIREPRATAGMLDELRPVAGLMMWSTMGACACAERRTTERNKTKRSTKQRDIFRVQYRLDTRFHFPKPEDTFAIIAGVFIIGSF